jgi:hypothetical protein
MSSKEEVLDVLRSEKHKAGDPDERVREWQAALNSLFESFRTWLQPLTVEKLATVELNDHFQITEPGLGTYRAPEITIRTLKGESILIQPRGRNIVGAEGRVDIVRDPKKVILVREHKTRAWKFAEASRQNRRWEFEDLSEETFWTHLKALIAD